MAFRIRLYKRAKKELDHLDKITSTRILEKLKAADFPFPPNLDVKKMQGEERLYRLRIGEFRVIFEVDKEHGEIWVRRIASRGEVYLGY
jgi:mRNA interferase RelE/StbE